MTIDNATFRAWMVKHEACQPARDWVGDRDLATAWAECKRGDWSLWAATQAGLDVSSVVYQCAERARQFAIRALAAAYVARSARAVDAEWSAYAARAARAEAAGAAEWAAARSARSARAARSARSAEEAALGAAGAAEWAAYAAAYAAADADSAHDAELAAIADLVREHVSIDDVADGILLGC